MLMSKSRIEKFLYALYSLDSSDLPNPLSRIEELYKCLVTGEEPPTFEPLSRVEKYLMAILGVYDANELPNPISRVEVLLHKLAIGDDNLDDVKSFLSKHEELLGEIVRYALYTLSTEFNTLYNTAEKPVKSAVLNGNTGYHDIVTGDILDTFDETKNLELVSVQMPVLTTTGKNLFNLDEYPFENDRAYVNGQPQDWGGYKGIEKYFPVKPNTTYTFSNSLKKKISYGLVYYDANYNVLDYYKQSISTFTTPNSCEYIRFSISSETLPTWVQIEQGSVITSYEPYKSTTVTCNEEVELRGVGEVKDELDLLTGELTQRIGEVVLDGSETWNYESNYHRGYIQAPDLIKSNDYRSRIICDGNYIILTNYGYMTDNSQPTVTGYCDVTNVYPNNNWIYVSIPNITSLEGLKQHFTENPLTIQYQLAAESVKTVDLSIVDQDGSDAELSTFNDITHVTLSSERLIPEAELEVATKAE